MCGGHECDKSTAAEMDRMQNMVGRFILQVPSATSRVLAWSPEDPWTKSWFNIQRDVGVITNFQSKQALQNALQHMSIRNIMQNRTILLWRLCRNPLIGSSYRPM